jgi:hypothetical protein
MIIDIRARIQAPRRAERESLTKSYQLSGFDDLAVGGRSRPLEGAI